MSNRRRRGRGEGSIRRKPGRDLWEVTVNLGYDAQGKRRRITKYAKTKREALALLAELQQQAATGTLPEPTRLTVEAYLTHWLEDVMRPTLRPSTYARYESLVRNHLVPRIGRTKLQQLKPSQVQALYSQMEADGVGARTRELAHVVLRKALQQAVEWGYLATNPCDRVRRPRAPKRRMEVLTPEQAARLLEEARGHRLYALLVVLLTCGLRWGEAAALQWEDVDLKRATLTIRRSVTEVKGKHVIGEPKTARGRRQIALPKVAVEALREHRKRMLAEGHPGPWVFCDQDGGLLRLPNFRRRVLFPLLDRAGLPRIRPHDLRHTCATLLLSQGVHPKVVSEMLGHAQVSITLDVYSHVLPTLQREAASRMDALFS